MSRSISVIFAVIVAIAAGWLGFKLSGAGRTIPAPTASQGSEAPGPGFDQALARLLGASYPDVNGKPQALRQWAGKVLVVNFWATWCPPCREEMPGFSRLYTKYSGNGVQFVGIGVDDADKVMQYQKDSPVSYPVLVAGLETMGLTAQLGNRTEGLPFTVFVDRQGQLRSIKVGLMSEAEVESRLKEML